VCDGDPRVPFIIDDPAERRRLNRKSPMVREAKRMVEKLNRGEPVCYPCGHVGGRDRFPEARNIPWLADHREMWVDADDSVRPAQPYRLALA